MSTNRYAFGVGLRQLDTELLLIAEGNANASFEVGSFGVLETFTATVLTETALCRQCPIGQFLAAPCTLHSNIQCLDLSPPCDENEIEIAPATPTSDRQCDTLACSPGATHFISLGVCSSCTRCRAAVEFEVAPCSTSSDRTCASVSTCNAQSSEVIPPTQTSDRVCSDICASNQYIAVSNGVARCENHTECAGDTFEFLPPRRLADRVCVPRTVCSSEQFETVLATPTSNRQCAFCNSCRRATTDVIFVVDTSTSVCNLGGFSHVKDFLQTAARTFPLGPDQVRISTIVFNSAASIAVNFTSGSTVTTALSEIDSITCEGGAKRTDLALQLAREQLLNPFIHRRSGVPTVLVFIGAGTSTLPFATQNETTQLDLISLLSRFVPYVPSRTHSSRLSFICLFVRRYAVSIGSSNVDEFTLIVGGNAARIRTVPTMADVSSIAHSFYASEHCSSCLADEFESAPCGSTSDSVCSPLRTCSANAFEAAAPTSTTDRVCHTCTVCDGLTQYASVECTSTSDAQCSTCLGTCPPFTFEATACSPTTDRICQSCSFRCQSDSFFVAPCSTTADITCAPCTVQCPSGQYVSGACSGFSDTQCTNVSTCSSGQYERTPPGLLQDRTCADIRDCGLGEFETFEPTATSDRQCAVVTQCAPGFLEDTQPTATTDRVCVFSGVCDLQPRVYDLVWMMDASGSISQSEFTIMKDFVADVMSRETISPTNVQVCTPRIIASLAWWLMSRWFAGFCGAFSRWS